MPLEKCHKKCCPSGSVTANSEIFALGHLFEAGNRSTIFSVYLGDIVGPNELPVCSNGGACGAQVAVRLLRSARITAGAGGGGTDGGRGGGGRRVLQTRIKTVFYCNYVYYVYVSL